MDDTVVVCLPQSLRYLQRYVLDVFKTDDAPARPVRKALSLVIFHRDEQLAIGRLIDLVNRTDVDVLKGRGILCLSNESLLQLLFLRIRRGENFECGDSFEPHILGLVDDPHPSLGNLFKNLVVRNCLSEHGFPLP